MAAHGTLMERRGKVGGVGEERLRQSLYSSQFSIDLDFAFESQLVEEVLDIVLVLQQPVDRWFAVHGFRDRLGSRFAIGFE